MLGVANDLVLQWMWDPLLLAPAICILRYCSGIRQTDYACYYRDNPFIPLPGNSHLYYVGIHCDYQYLFFFSGSLGDNNRPECTSFLCVFPGTPSGCCSSYRYHHINVCRQCKAQTRVGKFLSRFAISLPYPLCLSHFPLLICCE